MYTSYFGLNENPFNLTPDPRYLFLSPHHREAMDHLLYGINERKGFILITGGIGTGKTTLCRALLNQLDSSIRSALVLNSYISDIELLRSILQEFGMDADPTFHSKKEYIDLLNRFLLTTFSRGGNAVLLIDEAQNLSRTALEQVRMISNLETDREKLIQIVLVGQPELLRLLSTPPLKQLEERITVRYHLSPLRQKDVEGYVRHRLVVGGSKGEIKFTKDAFARLYSLSRGNPRRINAICDRALLIAYAKESQTISGRIIRKAWQDIKGESMSEPAALPISRARAGVLTALLALLIMTIALAGWNFRQDILRIIGSNDTVSALPAAPPHPKQPRLPASQKPAGLFLDHAESLAALFRLFESKRIEQGRDSAEVNAGLITMALGPEYYLRFKKPFRIKVPECPGTSASPARCYLVVRGLDAGKALVTNAAGKDRLVAEDVLIGYGTREISWVYPYKNRYLFLKKGMYVPEVLEIQTALRKMGYTVEPTNIYDGPTFHEVLQFQKDFGLMADGIVGPQTRALLYQLVD